MEFLKKYFYGILTPAEEAWVQDWLVRHMDEPQVQQTLMDIMDDMEEEDRVLSSSAFSEVCRKLGLERKLRRRMLYRKIGLTVLKAAACLLLFVAGAAAYRLIIPDEPVEWLEVKVPFGEQKDLVLSDGTHLYLNSGSRITYPSRFQGEERRVFVDGEIFAEVAEDPEHPFHINSGDVSVKVLGTTFNFKAFDDSQCVEMLLLDGSVRMDIGPEGADMRQFTLRPGEMLQYVRDSREVNYKTFNPHTFRSFRDQGAIHFFNISLEDIAADLERIFGTRIVIIDEELEDDRYFAWFTNNEDLEQILNGLNVDGKMKLVMRDDIVYIAKNRL